MTHDNLATQQRVATRVAKNTLAQLVALASTTVSKLLITIVIARVFGPQEVGDFAFVITFTMLFTFFSTAGVTWTLIREVATHREQVQRYADNGLSIVILMGAVTIPLMVAIVALMGYPDTILLAVALAGLALAFDGMAQLLNAVLSGFERMELGAIITIVQEVTFAVIGVLALALRLPFMWLFAIYAPSKLAGLIVVLPIYRRLFGRALRPRFEWPFVKQLVRTSLPYAVNMALGPVYVRIDVVMLSFYQGSAAVGLYEAATSIFYRFNILARTFNLALMPLMAREFETQAERVRKYINAAAKSQIVMGMPLTVLCMMLAERLMLFLYGPDFRSSGVVFGLMASMTMLRFLDNTLATVLTAVGLQSGRSWAVAWAAVFNVVVNLWVIPRYSFVGATLTTILTEMCFFGALYVLLSRRVSRPIAWQLALKPGIAGAGMALSVWLLRGLGLLPLVVLSALVYLGLLLALGVLSREEWRLLWRVSQLYRLTPTSIRRTIFKTL